eukprot:2603473-Prorocentrum_lima.AAC.1
MSPPLYYYINVLQLFASKAKPIVLFCDALFVLDLRPEVGNGVCGLVVNGDRFACEEPHKDLL